MITHPYSTRIFLDSGDPTDTTKAINLLGSIDGQTTNPSLVSKNPDIIELCQNGRCTTNDINTTYHEIVKEIRSLLFVGSISIEVYADSTTSSENMLSSAREMNSWIEGAHIKFPTTTRGIKAAILAISEGIRVNMTLCFTQEQALAVHLATKGASEDQVYISPFIGRLDDKGLKGIDLITNITRMYQELDSHVQVLSASIRSMDHMYEVLRINSNIITVPLRFIEKFNQNGKTIPEGFEYNTSLSPIEYKDLHQIKWQDINISHILVDEGIERFVSDWNKLLNK